MARKTLLILVVSVRTSPRSEKYSDLESQQSSPDGEYLVLTQADIANALLTASSNTACGTLLVAGNIGSAFQLINLTKAKNASAAKKRLQLTNF